MIPRRQCLSQRIIPPQFEVFYGWDGKEGSASQRRAFRHAFTLDLNQKLADKQGGEHEREERPLVIMQKLVLSYATKPRISPASM